MHADDENLIARFLEGDPQSAGTLEGWIGQAASPYRAQLGSDWQDAVQDCLLELTRLLRAGAFRGEARLRTYVWRIANHLCLARARSRRTIVWEDFDETGSAAEGPTPLAHLLRAESWRFAVAVLASVPRDCLRLWEMILDGMSYPQIAERLSVSAEALRARALRCRRKAVASARRLARSKPDGRRLTLRDGTSS